MKTADVLQIQKSRQYPFPRYRGFPREEHFDPQNKKTKNKKLTTKTETKTKTKNKNKICGGFFVPENSKCDF